MAYGTLVVVDVPTANTDVKNVLFLFFVLSLAPENFRP